MATGAGVTGSTSQVATQLRGVLQSLMAPTDAMAGLISDLGYESGQAMIQEMLVAASRGLAPNQKARLAVLMGKHDRQMRFLMMRQMVKRGLGRDAPRADDDGEDDEGGLMFP